MKTVADMNMMNDDSVILGIDTSCYTTSVAAVTPQGAVLSNRRRLLAVPKGGRGLRQSEMVFQHTRNLPDLMEELRGDIGEAEIGLVAVSQAPRPAAGSYMPAFLAGAGLARSLGAALAAPVFFTTHQEGHMAAGLYESGLAADDFLALHVSGGTTEILRVRRMPAQMEIRLLGGSSDVHAGQFVDRVGVALGLSFPAGPALEALAREGTPAHALPVAVKRGDGTPTSPEPPPTLTVSFGGAQSQVQRWIEQGGRRSEDIAAEVFSHIARSLTRLIEAAVAETGLTKVLMVGGVMSSELLRADVAARLQKRGVKHRLYFAKPGLSADNALGVALLGAEAAGRNK